jgi:hypothetical protein
MSGIGGAIAASGKFPAILHREFRRILFNRLRYFAPASQGKPGPSRYSLQIPV